MSEEKLNEFFLAVRDKLDGIKGLVKLYGVEDRFTMTFIGGIYQDVETEDGSLRLAAAADFVVQDEEELDELLSAATEIYQATERQQEGIPEDLKDTDDWTHDDWVKFINKNSDDSVN